MKTGVTYTVKIAIKDYDQDKNTKVEMSNTWQRPDNLEETPPLLDCIAETLGQALVRVAEDASLLKEGNPSNAFRVQVNPKLKVAQTDD